MIQARRDQSGSGVVIGDTHKGTWEVLFFLANREARESSASQSWKGSRLTRGVGRVPLDSGRSVLVREM